ncbi:MAG: glycosyltransferase [Leptolyngbya sp. LCM1.Bin17]|nr:MAG: glycosyltransferase [Leptolyngbya sp. LCM1.Bin17]
MVNPSPLFVSVIIPVFNDTDRLRHCLQCLAQQTYPCDRYEVIVVDNSPSPDPSLSPLIAEYPGMVLAHEPRRGSYAARNQGIKLAQSTVIAFTDSDCRPAPDWLEKGTAWLTRYPDCGFVAGQIRFFFQNPDNPTIPELYDSLNFLQQQRYVEECHFGATANLFTFKARFDSVGFFNSDLFSGGDHDWGHRMFAAGYPQLYADDVVIAHPARHSFRELRNKALRITIGGHYLTNANNQPFKAFFSEVLPEFKPHLQYAVDCINDPTLKGWRRKIECYLVYLSIRYLKAAKRIQLYLSHHWFKSFKPKPKSL